jgi:hypothetical protein
MRTYLPRITVIILACLATFHTAVFQTTAAEAAPAAISSARRDVEVAELELRRYLNVAYPSQRDHLDAQMILTKAEIEVQRRLVREYERMSRGKTSKPFLVTLSDARMALLSAQLSHQRHCDEKSRLEKFHSDQCRLYELRVDAAREHLTALLNADKR